MDIELEQFTSNVKTELASNDTIVRAGQIVVFNDKIMFSTLLDVRTTEKNSLVYYEPGSIVRITNPLGEVVCFTYDGIIPTFRLSMLRYPTLKELQAYEKTVVV